MGEHGILCAKGKSKHGRESWVPDDDVTECSGCQTKFRFFTRKHHCRACGLVFCDSCTRYRIHYTAEARVCEDGYVEKEKRVCQPCYARIYVTKTCTVESTNESVGTLVAS